MTRTRIVMAGVLALVGLVWLLQGLGVHLGRSFMVGDPLWAVLGAAVIIGAPIYAYWPKLRKR